MHVEMLNLIFTWVAARWTVAFGVFVLFFGPSAARWVSQALRSRERLNSKRDSTDTARNRRVSRCHAPNINRRAAPLARPTGAQAARLQRRWLSRRELYGLSSSLRGRSFSPFRANSSGTLALQWGVREDNRFRCDLGRRLCGPDGRTPGRSRIPDLISTSVQIGTFRVPFFI
jgi:hypothetical protein